MKYETIRVGLQDRTATVTLSRPETHNAFDDIVVGELEDVFSKLANDRTVRCIILTGEGASFCAGANLNWMKSMAAYTFQQNVEDSRKMADIFEAVYKCPKPVIGRINGSAFGGGVGLMAACDHIISVPEAKFSFSEVKLGIAPAVISPYILRRVMPSIARRLFTSGERFTAEAAFRYGLVDEIAEVGEMDDAVARAVKLFMSSGPVAIARNKELVSTLLNTHGEQTRDYTIELIADLRTSPEGQEGIGAFLEKRKPKWSVK